jgi:Protein of unknown function (DUF1501)
MAYRLQSSAPELMDLSSESKATLDMYGCDPKAPSFARACLLARRMVERGVRFINIYHEGWDAHSNVKGNVQNNCKTTDQASAALIKDLKQRGMLDSTLVVWGGEFGRTPMVEASVALGRSQGRDHHPQAFTMWLAGGGIKPGITLGATDEMGFNIVENEVHVPDLHATILHQLGIDHEHLTFRASGLDFKLKGVERCGALPSDEGVTWVSKSVRCVCPRLKHFPQKLRGGLLGAVHAQKSELGFVEVFDRIIIEAPGDDSAEALEFGCLQNHGIDAGLFRFGADLVIEFRDQVRTDAVLRIAGCGHAELADDERAFGLVHALIRDVPTGGIRAEMDVLFLGAVVMIL